MSCGMLNCESDILRLKYGIPTNVLYTGYWISPIFTSSEPIVLIFLNKPLALNAGKSVIAINHSEVTNLSMADLMEVLGIATPQEV